MQTKHDYAAFDEALLNAIAEGTTKAGDLTTRLEDQAKPYCVEFKHGSSPPPPYRIVDRRLQVLRRAGKVQFSSASGWRLSD